MNQVLRIATRKSALALWQAHHVRSLLEARHDGLDVELVPVVTVPQHPRTNQRLVLASSLAEPLICYLINRKSDEKWKSNEK